MESELVDWGSGSESGVYPYSGSWTPYSGKSWRTTKQQKEQSWKWVSRFRKSQKADFIPLFLVEKRIKQTLNHYNFLTFIYLVYNRILDTQNIYHLNGEENQI
jgi:ribosomal protein L20